MPSTTSEPVEAAFARFIDAFNRLDWESFQRSFSTNVSLFNPQIPEATSLRRLDGQTEVELNFQQVFEAAKRSGHGPHIVPINVRTQLLTDAAVVTFEFNRGGGSYGRRTLVFVKETGGWKIIHVHASNVNGQ